MIPCRTKEWGGFGILGAKVFSDRCQHCDEPVVPICQRKDAEFVEDVLSVGDRGKEPIEVVLVHALREESDHSQKVAGVGPELVESGGSKRQFDRCRQALVVICLQYLRPMCVPFLGQSIVIPRVVRCGGGKQGYREGVEVEASEKVVDDAGLLTITRVDAVEDTTCRLHR